MATLTFHGAAQEVTGSCHLLDIPGSLRVLLDCGLHQGGDAIERIQKDAFDFDPRSIDAVVLSHAHLDHSGLLPKLVHQGFNGTIYCTEATAELLVIMLVDAEGIYRRDLDYENLVRKRKGLKSLKPEYTNRDVKKVLKLCQGVPYGTKHVVDEHISLHFHDAGHILGSAIVQLQFQEKGNEHTVVFSGDLGNEHAVLMNPPTRLTEADTVLMEGTYGNRNHRSLENTLEQFQTLLQETWQKRGNVMIPAFSVGRVQELLFHLGRLHHEGELDNWTVFLDSPMAIKVTKLYDRWFHLLDNKDTQLISQAQKMSLQTFLPNLVCAVTPEESMAINKIKSGAIIIAGSGMCTGGRIRHHFKQRIWNKRNTIIFCGFQARGTLGRILVDGARHIKLFRDEIIVKARIETLGGFSAHADQKELISWLACFTSKPTVYLVHGEADILDTLSATLWQEMSIEAQVPERGQSVVL